MEHEISIITGIQAIQSLNRDKYKVIPVYLTKENHFLIGKGLDDLATYKTNRVKGKEVFFTRKGLKSVFTKKVDVVISCVHGKGVEGGELAGFFEILGIPYTSIGVLGASISQDKITFKKLMDYEGVNIVPFTSFTINEWRYRREDILSEINALTFPVILKPSNLGSSIGIKKVDKITELVDNVNALLKYDDRMLVEKGLVKFREFNCAIINRDRLSQIEEVVTTHDILTFSDKYEEGPSKRIIPALIDGKLADEIYELTKKVARVIDNKGVVRVDYLYDTETSELYVNEVNTIPGSLSYYLYENKGFFFDELLDELIKGALQSHYLNKNKTNVFMSNVLNMKGIKK